MRPGALAAITTLLLAAACSLQSEELATTSIECTTGEDGSTTCKEEEDRPGDDGDTPGDEGDLVCSGTGCVAQCEYGDDVFRCDITCENGLTCQSSCQDGACSITCDCPDGGGDGGGGCEGEPSDECCRENPEDPACNPPCPDGSTDEDCYCRNNPEDPSCNPPPCPDGSTDDECDYCREHPEDPDCAPQPPDPCPDGSEECCQDNPEGCSP